MENNFFHDFPPFPSAQKSLFFSSRNALWHAVDLLGLQSGDEVLMPSYHCGAEVDPMVKRGMAVSLYNVHRDLSIDSGDLCRRMTSRTKAVLVIHYFGFPQDLDSIRGLCDKKGIFLIEDCTHALFNTSRGKPVGSMGDIAFFSLRKSMPVPDGSILLYNRALKVFTKKLKNPPTSYEAGCSARQMILKLTGINNRGLLLGYKFFAEITGRRMQVDNRSYLSRWHSYSVDNKKIDWAISRTTLSILNRMTTGRMHTIRMKRRKNYAAILQGVKDSPCIKPLVDDLPEGVCPSVFPMIVPRRDEKYGALISNGFFCTRTWPTFYPGFSWREFPEAVFLKNNVISLPVDQDSTVDRIAEVIRLLEL